MTDDLNTILLYIAGGAFGYVAGLWLYAPVAGWLDRRARRRADARRVVERAEYESAQRAYRATPEGQRAQRLASVMYASDPAAAYERAYGEPIAAALTTPEAG